MLSPTARSMALLRRRGFVACAVERWIERAGVHVDAFGIGDILAAHPHERAIVLVQATTASHLAHRLAKARARPELATWLRAGGQFEVWGWSKRGGRWEAKIVAVQAEDLAAIVREAPRKRQGGRRPRQMELF